ncbi:sigma-70 family RNA polymerase sigma factor [Pseudomonas kuykendallii]|uniref:sigma-70 family RNA polymerase sigma factor n=1 Tax=Pseudomonas kuykendallii TaxID=1007099 RepID=UPI00387E3024
MAVPTPQAALNREIGSLYQRHHGWLCGWLSYRLGNACEAADLAQDTFIRVLIAAGKRQTVFCQDELREPRAYLTTVAKRVLLNHYRRQSLERAWLQALALLPEADVPSPEQQWLLIEALHEIDAMLDGLPGAVRQAFLLAQLEGVGYAEIGQRLGVCERSVKRYVAQGLAHCMLALA